MSLTITINNIDNLTDNERAILRHIVGDEQVTLTGPTATKQFIESLADTPVEPKEVFSPHTAVVDITAPASAELDANGLPWDARIHASTRSKVAAGTWKYARGVDADYIKTVERELRAVQDISVPTPPAAPAISVPTPPAAPAISVPTPPAPTGPMTFAQLMQYITPMLVSGKLTQPVLQDVVGKLGLPHMAALGARPDLVETVRAAIDEAMQ